MSRHPLDLLALLSGLPLFVLGVTGLLDDTDVVEIGSGWVWVAVIITVGVLGIAVSFANLFRDRVVVDPVEQDATAQPDDQGG